MKIYMDWFHDKESINNDPREAITKAILSLVSKEANKKMNLIQK